MAQSQSPAQAPSVAAEKRQNEGTNEDSSASQKLVGSSPDMTASVESSDDTTSADSLEKVVWLHSGAIVRGTLVDYVPNERVVLQLANGEVKEIAWSEVKRTSWLEHAAQSNDGKARTQRQDEASSTASNKGLQSPAKQAQIDKSSAPGVVVRLVSNRQVELQMRARHDTGSWKVACTSPCGQRVQVYDQQLRVSGAGITESNPFFLDGKRGEESLKISAGSTSTYRWGQGTLFGGIAVVLAGGLAYGLGKMNDTDAASTAGLVGMIAGGVGIVVSLPLLAIGSTKVQNGDGIRVATGRIQQQL